MIRRLNACVLAAFVLLMLGGAAGLAQDRDYYTARQHGAEHGYRDGYHHALEDRAAGAGYSFKSEDFDRGDRGYERYMGDREDFVRAYRDAYQKGYDDGFYGRTQRLSELYPYPPVERGEVYAPYGPPPRTWGYTDVAFDMGYRIGLHQGQRDAGDNKSFDPNRHDDYRDADKGYHNDYGSKAAYRNHFRQGYMRGYQDGFGRLR